MNWRNGVIAIVLTAAAAGGGLFWWRQREQAEALAAEQAIRKETVARGVLLSVVSATGSVAAEEQLNLHFDTAQPLPVVELAVSVGQAVRRGQLLARLETTDLELAVEQAGQAARSAELALAQLQAAPRAEDLALAEANLQTARMQLWAASVGRSPEEVDIALLNLQLARNALNQTYRTMDQYLAEGRFDKKQSLAAQEEQQIEAAQIADLRYQAALAPPNRGPAASAQAAVDQAQAALDRLLSGPDEADLKIARLRLEQAQAGLALARRSLAGAEIRAPFDGLVAAVNVREAELAAGALPAIVLVNAARFHVNVAVDEVDVPSVAAGQHVTVTLDALPDLALGGTVEKVAPTATTNQGVVSYAVRILVESAAAPLRAGMTATADIVVAEARDAVLIPNWAIRRDRDTGRAYVSVLREGELVDVLVELGLRNETFSEARAGVQAGEVVAVDTRRGQFSLFGGGQ